jgi:FdhD protein
MIVSPEVGWAAAPERRGGPGQDHHRAGEVAAFGPLSQPGISASQVSWRNGQVRPGHRTLPEETPIALTYDGSTQAVMMATPSDIEDFAVGFSMTEGIVASPADIESLEVLHLELGIEARMRLTPSRGRHFAGRRRQMAGPVGCGLCGIESLSEATRPCRLVTDRTTFTAEAILAAMARLPALQALNRATRAVHSAAWCRPDGTISAVREDVGRHNALDKLAGALARSGHSGVGGAVLLTSRLSLEMVQKTAAIGCGIVVAVSAPTALAIRTAEACGITVVAVARGDGFEVFTSSERIILAARARGGDKRDAG